MASLQAAVGVRRNERDDFHLRRRDDLDHHRDGGRGEPPERALFPRSDECANGIVVVNGATGAHEREPPAHAVTAAAHGPGGRRPAALAERRLDPRQSAHAGRTELRGALSADPATLRARPGGTRAKLTPRG